MMTVSRKITAIPRLLLWTLLLVGWCSTMDGVSSFSPCWKSRLVLLNYRGNTQQRTTSTASSFPARVRRHDDDSDDDKGCRHVEMTRDGAASMDRREVLSLPVLLLLGAQTTLFRGTAASAASSPKSELDQDDGDYSDYATTASGLRYKTMQQPERRSSTTSSSSQTPKTGDTVLFVYSLWLYKFCSIRPIASSRQRMSKSKTYSDGSPNEPTSFRIGQGGALVPGLEEGISTMSVGERRRIIIPPSLAFGPKTGLGGLVPTNSTLYMDVELLGIEPVI